MVKQPKTSKKARSAHRRDPLSRDPAASLAAQKAHDELVSILERAGLSLSGRMDGERRDVSGSLESKLHDLERKMTALKCMENGWYHIPKDTPIIGALISGGLVEYLMGVGLEFLQWDELYEQAETPLMTRAWVLALECTAELASFVFDNDSEPMYASFPRRWLASAPPLVHALAHLKLWDELQYFSHRKLQETITLMSAAGELVVPLISPTGIRLWKLPRPSREVCEDTIRLLFQISHGIVENRNNDEDIMPVVSAAAARLPDVLEHLSKHINPHHLTSHALSKSSPESFVDLSEMTGLSHETLVRSLINARFSDAMHARYPPAMRGRGSDVAHLRALAHMLQVDPSRACVEAYASEKVLSWVGRLMREIIASTRTTAGRGETTRGGAGGLFDDDEFDDAGATTASGSLASFLPSKTEWYTILVQLSVEILRVAGEERISGPAVEMIKGNMLFTIETLGLDIEPGTIRGNMPFLMRFWVHGFDRATQADLLEKAVAQLEVVTSRLLKRSNPEVDPTKVSWIRMCLMAQTPDGEPIKARGDSTSKTFCATLGCTSTSQATMHCVACKTSAYCDRACQLKDWKSHKSECKKVAAKKGEGKAKKGNA